MTTPMQPMTLDEAIDHAQKKAGECTTACGLEHAQLARWLCELRDFREYQKFMLRAMTSK
jgi:hypothetical protein